MENQKLKSKNQKSNQGFTLVEVLITIFILAVAVVGTLAMFPVGLQVEKSAKMTNIASHLAQAKMEEIVSKSYEEISPGVSIEPYGFDSDFLSYQRETKIDYVDPNQDLESSTDDLGIKKIEITVSWKSPFEKEVKIFTLISEK